MRAIGTVCGVTALLLTGSAVRADVLWSADWSAPKPTVISDSGSNQLLLSTGAHFDGNGSTSNVFASQVTVATPFKGSSDVWTNQNYDLDVHIIDKASNTSKDLEFTGAFSGTANTTSSSISSTFVSGKDSYSFTLGGNQYTVTIGPFVANGQGTNAGVLDAQVTVQAPVDSQPPPQTHATPEPSTLVLAAIGVVGAGVSRLRRRMSRASSVVVVG